MADATRIIVLEGDQTGQELLEQALRVLDPSVCSLDLELEHYDLSLENRRTTDNEVVLAAAKAMVEAGYGIKAATITPEGKDDVGSPNTILREQIDGQVIVRTGRRIPGVPPVAAVYHPIAVVRMAVGDAYGAEERRESRERRRGRVPDRAHRALRSAGRSPSTRSGRPSGCTRGCTAARSGPSARSTKGCSRKSSTQPRSGIRTSRTTLS